MARGQFNKALNETGWFSGVLTVTLMEYRNPAADLLAMVRQHVNLDVERIGHQPEKQPMSPSNQLNTNHYNRRDLLKAAGIVAAGGALGLPQRTQAETTTGDKPRITIAGHTEHLDR